jgi:antitoxin (DNA-binding transcriptional repressor) of toxin-antitoxin stability system
VAAGETLVVTDAGRPVAEITPVDSLPLEPRQIGFAAGKFTIPDDFDEPLPEEVLRSFEGRK